MSLDPTWCSWHGRFLRGRALPMVLCSSLAFLILGHASGAGYWVDVDARGGPADDSGPGTRQRPWRTLSRIAAAQEPRLQPGDTVLVRGGVYREQVNLGRGGTADRPLTIRAYPGEKPTIDGEGQRAYGLRLPREGGADHVIIQGLTLTNFRAGGVGISASGRTGVVIRGVEVTGAGTGIAFNACTECQLLQSHVHHCQGNDVLIDSSCSDFIIADNHIHHARNSHALSIYAPGDGVRGQGMIVSVEPHGTGLGQFTTENLDLSQVRDGTLTGQDERGSVSNPGLILFFPDRAPEPDGQPLAGGSVRLQDGRDWFVLRNNPDWGGKPYSPDGKRGLFEVGQAGIQSLARAKSVYVAYTFSPSVANRDIQVLRNEVDHAAVQGIWVQRSEGVLLQGNRTHHNGATGIQIESLCRRIWLDGNVSYANSIAYSHETGIWLDETIDAVVQNNVVYENQKGMGVTQCEWVLVRRNVIHHNQAQHVTQNRDGCRSNAGGFWYSGGRHNHLGAPPGAQHNAFVHNTLLANGTEVSTWGGIQHGLPGYPRIGVNRIFNSLVLDTLGAHAIQVGCAPALLDGNIYHGNGPVQAFWKQAEGKRTYPLSQTQGLADYQRDTGQEAHSRVVEVAFVNAPPRDFHLAARSAAMDAGQPLTRTTRAGSGAIIPVEDVSCFTAGLKTRAGKVLMPGDEIVVGKLRARISGLDRRANTLALDRPLRWQPGDPVSYAYAANGPDVGAFETDGTMTVSENLTVPLYPVTLPH